MKIINKTKNTTLAEDAVLADTFFKRVNGLLGKKELQKGRALIIRPCNSIHTFFMRFAIDVLFVSKDNKVVKTASSLRPFRITPLYFNADFVIELPVGAIQSSSTIEGDTLLLE